MQKKHANIGIVNISEFCRRLNLNHNLSNRYLWNLESKFSILNIAVQRNKKMQYINIYIFTLCSLYVFQVQAVWCILIIQDQKQIQLIFTKLWELYKYVYYLTITRLKTVMDVEISFFEQSPWNVEYLTSRWRRNDGGCFVSQLSTID